MAQIKLPGALAGASGAKTFVSSDKARELQVAENSCNHQRNGYCEGADNEVDHWQPISDVVASIVKGWSS